MGKCSILFGDQCIEAVQVELQGILKYETQCFEEKYLGLPEKVSTCQCLQIVD
jgi:hypothetical protein